MRYTWRDLLQPQIVLQFWKAFLLAGLPLAGLGSFANGVTQGPPHITAFPTGPMLAAAIGAGLLNGIIMVTSLLQAPPIPKAPPGG